MVEIVLSEKLYLPDKTVKALDALVDKGVATSRSKAIEKIVKGFLDEF